MPSEQDGGGTPQSNIQSAYRMASFLAGAGVGGMFVSIIIDGGGHQPHLLLLGSLGIFLLGIVAFAYVKVEGKEDD